MFLHTTAATAAGAALGVGRARAASLGATGAGSSTRAQDPDGVVALTFDVFGTVVDWRGSIIREGELLASERDLEVDWAGFADAWRRGYGPAMSRVRTGELPWRTIDELHRMILDQILPDFGLADLSESDRIRLNRAWHRLSPWPDTVSGLNRLRARFLLATLSNGNVSLLADMARNAGLPWDVVLSAELAGRYKPDPEVYRTAADLLDLPPERIMMVAAHKSDLRAAGEVGLRTAWVARPLEWGPDRDVDTAPDPEFDYSATDFLDLAGQLGA